MALNSTTIEQLTRDGYGPLRFVARAGVVETTWSGNHVVARAEAGTLHVATERSITWPEAPGIDPSEVAERIDRALAEVTIDRQQLCRAEADVSRSLIRVSLWIDAEQSDPADLATAVRAVTVIADLAEWAVDLVGARLDVEAQVRELGEEVELDLAAAEEAERATPADEAAGFVVAAESAIETPGADTSAESAEPATPRRAPGASPAAARCYVLAPLDVLDPADTQRVLAQMTPGVWYVLLDEQDGWVRVADQDRTFEGWAPARHVHRGDD